jgi:hypothetical protein
LRQEPAGCSERSADAGRFFSEAFPPTFIFVALPHVIADLSIKKVIGFPDAIIEFFV